MDLKRVCSAGVRSGWIPDSPLYWGILIMTIKVGLASTDIFEVSELVDNVMNVAGMLIFLYYALRGWPDFKGMLLCWIGLGVIGVAALRIRNFHLLITAMTVLALRNGDIQKAVKLIFNWKCLLFAGEVLLSIVLYFAIDRPIGKYYEPRFRFFIPSRFRFYFGGNSATAPADIVFCLSMMWCYLHFGRIRWKDAAAILAIATVTYMLCVSRMPYLLTFGMLTLVLLYQNRQERENPLLNAAGKWLAPGLSVFFISVMPMYTLWPELFWCLDGLLTGRMRVSTTWYLYRGLTWMGEPVNGVIPPDEYLLTKHFMVLDCTYQNMAVWMGLLPLVVICIGLYLLARRKNTRDNVMIVLWAIYSISEGSGLNCYLMFALILIASALPNIQGEGKREWCPFHRKRRNAA